MLSLLFDSKFWYGAMLVCAIVAVIYLCFKYPGSRVYVASFVVIVLLGLTAYCGIQLNYYYSAEGGIYGKLSGIITNNTVEKLEETKFSLNNIVLTEDESGEFSAIILSDEKLDLKTTTGKYMFVNGVPCSTSDTLTNGIFATYHYSFKDSATKEIINDTLLISFSYFENGYRLKLSTEGGQVAVDYWNTYFSRNNFVITIEDFSYLNTQDFDIFEDKAEEYVTLNYYIDDELYSSMKYPKNSIISNFFNPAKSDYIFLGWSLDKINIIDRLTLQQNTNLYAKYTYKSLDFTVDGNTITGYTGENSELIIPASYSLHEGNPVVGQDIKITSIAEDCFKENEEITKVVIGENVTKIGARAFFGCINLSEVVIGEKVKTIGTGAFAGIAIDKVDIPDSVKTIKSTAFFMCTSLQKVIIGAGIETLEYYIFEECTSLNEIIINASNPPIIDTLNYSIPINVKVYVADEAYEAYKSNTDWSVYTIFKISEM